MSTELDLLQGYFAEFKGMLSDIAEDVDVDELRNAEAFKRVLLGMRKLCAEFARYAKEEASAAYERDSVDYDPDEARSYVEPVGAEVEAYIDTATGRRVGVDAKGREWITEEEQERERERDAMEQGLLELFSAPSTVEPMEQGLLELFSAPSTVEPSVSAPPVLPSSIGGTMLDNYTWYKDETINGDARDIFTWILQVDPLTCSAEQFIEGLLYARIYKDGKATSLTQRELAELLLLRAFPGYPTNIKGATDKVRDICKQLKASKDFTKKGLEELTKRGYPTASFYTQTHIDALEAARAPCSLPGDDLDAICEQITADPLPAPPVEEQVIEQEESPKVDLTDAVARAKALLGL
jgi:hypothetical protein